MNPENLTQEEIKRKIQLLEHSITICYIRSGPAFCVNREHRAKYSNHIYKQKAKIIGNFIASYDIEPQRKKYV